MIPFAAILPLLAKAGAAAATGAKVAGAAAATGAKAAAAGGGKLAGLAKFGGKLPGLLSGLSQSKNAIGSLLGVQQMPEQGPQFLQGGGGMGGMMSGLGGGFQRPMAPPPMVGGYSSGSFGQRGMPGYQEWDNIVTPWGQVPRARNQGNYLG